MRVRTYDEGVIERWRIEPKWGPLEFDEGAPSETAPPLWIDLTVASIAALVFWIVAAVLIR